jgi:hypothetical protein
MFKTTINAAGEFQIRESEMIAEHLPEMIRTTGRQIDGSKTGLWAERQQ